jgi:tetratricopeptide (TPR) repeat protein
MAYAHGDYARARACIEEAQGILHAGGQPGRPRFRVGSLNLLGRVAQEQGDMATYGEARVHHTQALTLARQLGLLDQVPMVLNDLGRLAWRGGDYAGARTHHAQALAAAREWGDRRAQAAALDHLGRVALSQGNADEAARCHTVGLALAWEFGDRARVAWCLEGLAAVAATQTDGRRAARLFGTAAALRNVIGAPLPPSQRSWHGHQLAAARATLAEAAFAAAWDEGRTASLEHVVTRALEG